jgi:hypothetical protein
VVAKQPQKCFREAPHHNPRCFRLGERYFQVQAVWLFECVHGCVHVAVRNNEIHHGPHPPGCPCWQAHVSYFCDTIRMPLLMMCCPRWGHTTRGATPTRRDQSNEMKKQFLVAWLTDRLQLWAEPQPNLKPRALKPDKGAVGARVFI